MELDTPSSSLNYEEKKNQLFASLDTVGKSIIKGTILDQKPAKMLDFNNQRTTRNKDAKSVYKFIGKESLFKKPEIPLEKCLKPRKSPDHKVNPHKWTKYSLDDADISDRTNTSAAFDFLKEIEARKDSSDDDDDDIPYRDQEGTSDPNSRKRHMILVKRTPSIKARTIEDSDEEADNKVVLKGSKVVMPEYVVGQKIKKNKNKLRTNTSAVKIKSKEMKLNHLFDDEENDDNLDD